MVGLGFIYLGATGLFRIYPHIVDLKSPNKPKHLSAEDSKIVKQLKHLVLVEKVYQEPGYNRSNLARELNISEARLSTLANYVFDKTVPQILNEYRVKDAKILLCDTDADITTITYESGFNSVATFNRVFKDITNMSPSEYRKKTRTL
jgi:AraC-like DNA-binding protein